MKTKILLTSLLTIILSGCASMEDRVNSVMNTVSQVGNIDYHRSGFWSDSDLTVEMAEDGTRTAHYKLTTKAPLGPSLNITVEGIPDSE